MWVPRQAEKQKTVQRFLNTFSQKLHMPLLLDSYQPKQVTWLCLISSGQGNLSVPWVWKKHYWWAVPVTTIVCSLNVPKSHLTVTWSSKTRPLGVHDCLSGPKVVALNPEIYMLKRDHMPQQQMYRNEQNYYNKHLHFERRRMEVHRRHQSIAFRIPIEPRGGKYSFTMPFYCSWRASPLTVVPEKFFLWNFPPWLCKI